MLLNAFYIYIFVDEYPGGMNLRNYYWTITQGEVLPG
jgi:hypothetical protein